MVYAYDLWVLLPVKDLYDNLIMLASIQAAKDMYEKGVLEMKDFKKEYGDFLSPILADMDWYNKEVTGKVRDTINNLYANGIDPLRSPEGRTIISRMINNIDAGRISNAKASAKNAEEYLKNKSRLEAAGLYDPDLERYVYGDDTILNWDSSNGIWTRTSPMQAKTLKELTEQFYNNRTPHNLTKDEVESFGKDYKYDPRYKYTGYTYNDLLRTASTNMPGLYGNIYGKYYRDKAKEKLILSGNQNPTEQLITELFLKDIADSNQEWLIKPVANADEFAKMAIADRYQRAREDRAFLRLKALERERHNNKMQELREKNSGKTEKPLFDYHDFLRQTVVGQIFKNTPEGRATGIGSASEYNQPLAEKYIRSAQRSNADNAYGFVRVKKVGNKLILLGKTTAYYVNYARNELKKQYGSKWNSLTQNQKDNLVKGRLKDKSFKYYNEYTNYYKNLKDKNNKFLTRLSVESDPAQFATHTRLQKDKDDNTYIKINNSTIDRIYSSDEVALGSSGVGDLYTRDHRNSKLITKQLRGKLKGKYKQGETLMRGAGYAVGRVGLDGSLHIFLKVKIVNKRKDLNTNLFNYNNIYGKGEVVYYDMGVYTDTNPNYKHDKIANLNPIVTDQSLASDRAVLKELGLGNTNVKSDESVVDLYGNNSYDDLYESYPGLLYEDLE